MGVTVVRMKIRKNKNVKQFVEEEFLVDSGATFTVAPGKVLRRLGIKPDAMQDFYLADGTKISRKIGDAYFDLEGRAGYAKVIFGQKGDSNLLGVLTLEALGLALDPLKRELKPMRHTLM